MKIRRDFPFQDLIGWQVDEMKDGLAKLSLRIEDRHLSPIGFAHGAVAFSLIDTAMGAAVASTLEGGEFPSTIEISIRYIRAVSGGDLTATAKVLQRTGRIVHLDGTASQGDEMVAMATASYLVSKFKG